MALTSEQLDAIAEAYCNRVVDEMDVKSMEQMLFDLLRESLSDQGQHEIEELICAIYGEDYYNELLKEATQDA